MTTMMTMMMRGMVGVVGMRGMFVRSEYPFTIFSRQYKAILARPLISRQFSTVNPNQSGTTPPPPMSPSNSIGNGEEETLSANSSTNSSHPPPPPHNQDEAQSNNNLGTFSIVRPIESFILRSRLTRDLDLARFLAKATGMAIYSVAGVTILGTLGVDTKPIIAGIGVTGFTIGFALKEIATNFLSGVLLVFNKPFQKGQHLKVMGAAAGQNLEGEVESIDARYVLLRTKDRGLLMVPSVVVYTNPILVSKLERKV